ncbi:unnamed protein product [Cylicocyclus nassatus]|uniref:Potassium channel domain-containing protein n=1 Tax=Cylicocyclus nassatus TaxID=53992 RepID=A0AA36DV95_CYLNA|nr:unnamed protein product [Cylicocyclus nassatus]
MFGAFVFSAIDDFMDKDNFISKCFFIFTTLTTIGYGDLAPKNALSKTFCLIYVGVGVPLLLLALANFGQLFAEFFWTCMMSIKSDIHVDPESRRKLPIAVVIALLLIHTMFGAVIFSFWLHKLPFVTAIYFSFVSITTIGFGDVIVNPRNNLGTAVLIAYLISGIIIMSMFITSIVHYLHFIYYLGRKPTTFRQNLIWFGGEKITVQEFVKLAASSFEVPPRQLRNTIKNLDNIIALALDDQLRKRSKIMFDSGTFLLDKTNEKRKLKHSLIATSSLSRLALQRHEKDIKALKVIHNHVNSSKSKKPNSERQNSRRVGKALAAIFSGVFALVNFMFAFYNLSRIAIGLARRLKGMTTKINLAEKALKERQLPSNLMRRSI